MPTTNPVLKKLQYKGQSPALVMDPPPEFSAVAGDIEGDVHSRPSASYAFAIAFVKSVEEARDLATKAGPALSPDAVFWLAYPKQTSKRYKATINRDSGNAEMQRHGFTGVALVSLDDDWSALRLKRV
jgi:hypothetical protein